MRPISPLPCLSFVGPSGSGKTTLLEGVVRELAAGGLRVVVLKATHHDIALDEPGKDSWRMGEAGAAIVGIVGERRSTLFLDRPAGERSALALAEWLALAPVAKPDLVLCEGFADEEELPKLRVARAERLERPYAPPAAPLVAFAWDGEGRPEGLGDGVELLPLRAGEVASFVRAFASKT